MIDDLFQAGTDAVGQDLVRRAPPAPKPAGASWYDGLLSTPAQSFRVGGARGIAFGAEISGAFGSVLGAYPEAMGASVTGEQRKQADEARRKLLADGPTYSNEAGNTFRQAAADWMPDPVTTGRAAQLVVGFGSFVTEVGMGSLFGGPLAPLLVGGSAAFTEADKLRLQGVDLPTRAKAAAVSGAVAGASIAVPVVGRTALETAGLVGVAGPGGFVGQNAATQTILKRAGYDKLAEQYDPFDPVGLALSTLVPAGIGAIAHGARAARAPKTLADVVLSNESGGRRYGADGKLLTSPKGAQGEMQVMPATSRDPGFGVAPAKDGSPEELARVGRDYLAAMQRRYPGDDAKAMAAYNAGPGALDAAIKAHPDDWLAHLPAETQGYVGSGLRKLGAENVAAAVRGEPDLVPAARVTHAVDAIERDRLTADGDLAGLNEHAAALEKAHDMLARDEPVNLGEDIRPTLDPARIARIEESVRARISDLPPELRDQVQLPRQEPAAPPAPRAAEVPPRQAEPRAAAEPALQEAVPQGEQPIPEQVALQPRVNRVAPDLAAQLPEGEKTTARAAIEQVAKEHGLDLQDANLAQVAAECFLRTAG